jgi:uncharacterized peroxidase-related enzyme
MFLQEPSTPEAAAYLEKDRVQSGYVMNLERAWAWRPDVAEGFAALRKQLIGGSTLSPREIAVLVCATAGALGDSYCSLAWGARLAKLADAPLAAKVLGGDDASGLSARESALRLWAGQVVEDPNATRCSDVEALRKAGLSDKEILEATAFIALRLAFSTVNDALGASPDAKLVADVPPEVRSAVTYGRREDVTPR